jgi:DNA ligase-4
LDYPTRIQLSDKLKRVQHDVKRDTPPAILEWAGEKPDVWFYPKDSVVLQVKATEIIPKQESYALRYTLRFPRVQKLRDDKSWLDCTTDAEILSRREVS